MSSTLEDYMNEQSLERISHMIVRNFEEATGHVLTEDEVEYTSNMTKVIFYEYTMTSNEDIKVADEREKEKLDDLLNRMVKNTSELIVHFIYAQVQAFVYKKRVEFLEDLLKDMGE